MGIVGAGSIGELTAIDLSRHPNVDLVAVADANEKRCLQLAARLDVPHAFATAGDLFAAELDAVYIAVPNAMHATLAKQALNTGLHVMLEKPFALNLEEARSVADTASRTGNTLIVGMNQRFERNVQRARALVAEGALGEVYHAKAFWRRRSGIPRIGSWFTDRASAGGGALLDIGVHMLDACLFVLDNFRPLSVSGATYTRLGNRGIGDGTWGSSEREHRHFDVDDFTTALIRLEGGVTLSLDASWALHQQDANDQEILLYGDEAGASVYAHRHYRFGAQGEYHIIEGAREGAIAYAHCNRAQHFVNVLLGEEQPAVTVEQALTVQSILDAIYVSAQTCQEVRL
jgi:predicted dehydrogenase|tara:strand:+ start:367 stop:1401 length:1035 start_codon:yes stop_codon:yes gene_type:complete